jgi:hypothetical protein
MFNGCPNKQMIGETPGPFSDHLVLNVAYALLLVVLSPLWLVVALVSFLGYLLTWPGRPTRSSKQLPWGAAAAGGAIGTPVASATLAAGGRGAAQQHLERLGGSTLQPAVLVFFGFVALPLFIALLPLYCVLAFFVIPSMIRSAAEGAAGRAGGAGEGAAAAAASGGKCVSVSPAVAASPHAHQAAAPS